MVRTSLLACVAGVLLVHGELAWKFLQSSPSGERTAASRARHAIEVYAVRSLPSTSPVPAARIEKPAVPAARPRPTIERVPKPASAPPGGIAPDVQGLAPVEAYRSPGELDRAALPRSSPDLDKLAGSAWSGLPLRVRLFIDAKGTVVDVQVMKSNEDPDLLDRVREMLLATGFIPGRLNGADVASFKDLELSLRELR
jgi:outer membrane biosynthesis protein TonB